LWKLRVTAFAGRCVRWNGTNKGLSGYTGFRRQASNGSVVMGDGLGRAEEADNNARDKDLESVESAYKH